MKIRVSALVFIAAVVAAIAVAASVAAQTSTAVRRSITDKDIFDFVWVTNPELSPDGSRVAFTRVDVDEKRTGYETSIWMVSTTGAETPIRMTNGKHDAQPRWSPDGKRLAFVRGGEKDETGKPGPSQIAILSLAGGEARIITDLPKGASSPVWSPDGKRIAFLSSTNPTKILKKPRAKRRLGKARPRASTNRMSTSSAARFIAATTKAFSIPSITSTSGCWTFRRLSTNSPSRCN